MFFSPSIGMWMLMLPRSSRRTQAAVSFCGGPRMAACKGQGFTAVGQSTVNK